MKRAKVYIHENWAGVLTEDEEGYHFEYNEGYQNLNEPVSLTLPVRKKPYQSMTLFPFFDGLIPEGWLLDIAEKNWKLDPRDRMGILMAACRDCIGAVSIQPFESTDDE